MDRVKAVISGASSSESQLTNTVPLRKGRGLVSTNLEKRGHGGEEERRSRGQGAGDVGVSPLRAVGGRDSCEATPWHCPGNWEPGEQVEEGINPKGPTTADGAEERADDG